MSRRYLVRTTATLAASALVPGARCGLNSGNASNSFAEPDKGVPKSLAVRVHGSKVQLDLTRLSVATFVVPLRREVITTSVRRSRIL